MYKFKFKLLWQLQVAMVTDGSTPSSLRPHLRQGSHCRLFLEGWKEVYNTLSLWKKKKWSKNQVSCKVLTEGWTVIRMTFNIYEKNRADNIQTISHQIQNIETIMSTTVNLFRVFVYRSFKMAKIFDVGRPSLSSRSCAAVAGRAKHGETFTLLCCWLWAVHGCLRQYLFHGS